MNLLSSGSRASEDASAANSAWFAANKRCNQERLEYLRARLSNILPGQNETTLEHVKATRPASGFGPSDAPPALRMLQERFALSDFETDLLLLAAAPDLDGSFAELIAKTGGAGGRATFALALAALPDAHWSALTPDGPLRRWHLLDATDDSGFISARLTLPERILHYLNGLHATDPLLAGLLTANPAPDALPPSQEDRAQAIGDVWHQSGGTVQLIGSDPFAARLLSARAAHLLQYGTRIVAARELPRTARERATLTRMLEREARLEDWILIVEVSRGDSEEITREAAALLNEFAGLCCLNTPDKMDLERPAPGFFVARPDANEQLELWREHLGEHAAELNGSLDRIVAQFDMDAAAISGVARSTLTGAEDALDPDDLWQACRVATRRGMNELAHRMDGRRAWEDLVLAAQQMNVLRAMTRHVRHRMKVYQSWGFARKETRGLGMSALFAGPSGTGKTMAAEIIAGELGLDLYRVDLSSLVSKYIGETEENLRKVFDAAESGGAILLFDEADALFGKRSEVKDSHDRHANIEVSYLLQRVEEYRGLAILTTNLKSAVDPAFLRRIRFVVQFAHPDAAHRAEIWRRVFPGETPLENIDPERLAKLNVPGGNIRNIALGAAFIAAEEDAPVRMEHIYAAAEHEYLKLEKALNAAEFGRRA